MMKVSSLSQSVIGLEVEALRIAEESIFENLKDNLYLQTVFHSLASPILGYRMAGTKENQIKVVSAYKHWREFWKLEWDELFQIPRVADFVNKTLFGATKSSLAENGIRSPKELQDEMKRYLGKALSS
jgi:hypothetical protein